MYISIYLILMDLLIGIIVTTPLSMFTFTPEKYKYYRKGVNDSTVLYSVYTVTSKLIYRKLT